MKILTWNIQATKGCDGQFNTARIINHIETFGHLDVICLQEVAKHIPSLNSEDQPSLIANQFSGFEAIWAPGFSVPDKNGKRCEFGNLTLVRRPLFRNARVHILPSPPTDDLQIPRTMAEVIIGNEDFQIAIFNAHLAFHSSVERIQQIQALTHLRNQIIAKSNLTRTSGAFGPFSYVDTIQAVVLCGDLNVGSESDEFKEHISDQNWVDCWSVQRDIDDEKTRHRQPTCGCFDRTQWPEGPHVRDYFLATQNIAHKTISVVVDVETNASDHQPVSLALDL